MINIRAKLILKALEIKNASHSDVIDCLTNATNFVENSDGKVTLSFERAGKKFNQTLSYGVGKYIVVHASGSVDIITEAKLNEFYEVVE